MQKFIASYKHIDASDYSSPSIFLDFEQGQLDMDSAFGVWL